MRKILSFKIIMYTFDQNNPKTDLRKRDFKFKGKTTSAR